MIIVMRDPYNSASSSHTFFLFSASVDGHLSIWDQDCPWAIDSTSAADSDSSPVQSGCGSKRDDWSVYCAHHSYPAFFCAHGSDPERWPDSDFYFAAWWKSCRFHIPVSEPLRVKWLAVPQNKLCGPQHLEIWIGSGISKVPAGFWLFSWKSGFKFQHHLPINSSEGTNSHSGKAILKPPDW